MSLPDANHDLIGLPIEELDTPALLLDRAACQGNLQAMADFFAGAATQLRPHFKNHKCTALARRQLEAGWAVGMTCAKLGEAEVLAEAGITDILIANQVVGRRKLRRLAELARHVDLKVAVDDPGQINWLSEAVVAAGASLAVLVEVDIGMGRCGAAPGEPALELARAVVDAKGLHFLGLQAYEGHVVYNVDAEQRSRGAREAMQRVLDTRGLIERSGLEVGVISGGSSATYRTTGRLEGIDEIQAGSYATMDWRYRQMVPEFAVALSVLARVISRRGSTAVLDVGLKGVGADFGPPRVKGYPEAEIPRFVSEEHGVVAAAPPDWRVGDVVELLPSHACTTCNLHRQMIVHADGRVVDVWPIEGSGRLA